MNQVVFADGKLWGALNTTMRLCRDDDDGDDSHCTIKSNQDGIAYFILDPQVSASSVSASVVKQRYIGLRRNHLVHPAIAATSAGRGVIAFSIIGKDFFPTAAYVLVDAINGASDIVITATGVGPLDGFSGYEAFFGSVWFARFGDYSTAAVDGDHIWIVSEYIGQTCSFAEWLATMASCGGTRTSVANWATRISEIRP